MKFKKIFVLILFLLGIMVLTVSTVSASSFGSDDIIIDGVDFVLTNYSQISTYKGDLVTFKLNSKINGGIEKIDNDKTLKWYVREDSTRGYYAMKMPADALRGDSYAYVDKVNNKEGCFLIFQKDKKKFIYNVASNFNCSSEDRDVMVSSIFQFSVDNNLTIFDSLDGKSFSDCKRYFPGASKTVLKHVFDESDSNNDGILSDSEFAKFKKVRDHTKKYAKNIKNNYPTKTAKGYGTGYCADHGRVKLNSKNQCPYCLKLKYDPTTKTSAW